MNPLIGAWLAHERGEPAEVKRSSTMPPPHLAEQHWRWYCACGYGWRTPADEPLPAVWRDGRWQPPLMECIGCHTWVSGHPLSA